jgi:hypothetical protein
MSNISCRPKASEGNLGEKCGGLAFVKTAGHVGCDKTWGDAIYGDTATAELAG